MFVKLTPLGTTGTGAQTTVYQLEVPTDSCPLVRLFEELLTLVDSPRELAFALRRTRVDLLSRTRPPAPTAGTTAPATDGAEETDTEPAEGP